MAVRASLLSHCAKAARKHGHGGSKGTLPPSKSLPPSPPPNCLAFDHSILIEFIQSLISFYPSSSALASSPLPAQISNSPFFTEQPGHPATQIVSVAHHTFQDRPAHRRRRKPLPWWPSSSSHAPLSACCRPVFPAGALEQGRLVRRQDAKWSQDQRGGPLGRRLRGLPSCRRGAFHCGPARQFPKS